MIALLLALSLPAMAQSTGTVNTDRLDGMDTSVQSLLSGRPTITGVPTYQNGMTVSSSAFTGSNTFTGNNTHAGQETMLAGSTITVSWLTMTRDFVFVSSADTTGLNAIGNSTHTTTIPTGVDISSVEFRMDYDCKLSSTNMLLLMVNGDQGANYNYVANGTNVGGTNVFDGGLTDHVVDMNPQGNSASGFLAGTSFAGHFFFKVDRGSKNNVSFDFTGKGYRGGYTDLRGGGVYSGSSVPSTISLYSSPYTTAETGIVKSGGGFMNCHTDLYRKGFQSQ